MKFLKFAAIGLVGLVIVLALIAVFLPSKFVVERSVLVDAPRDKIHLLAGDLERWPEWGPWLKEDPSIVTTLGATTTGIGAHQTWTGNSGSGELVFTASSPETGVEYDLSFNDTFRSTAALRYTPRGDQTEVLWTMRGDVGWDLLGRYFVLAMDTIVGPMFEEGLAELKRLAERRE